MFYIPTLEDYKNHWTSSITDEELQNIFKNRFEEEVCVKTIFNQLEKLIENKYNNESDWKDKGFSSDSISSDPYELVSASNYEKLMMEIFIRLTRELNQLKDKIDGENISTVSDSNV